MRLVGLLIVSASLAGAQVDWRFIRPSNTGIPGDICQTIFVDPQDRAWIAGYITFFEEGGVAHTNAAGGWTAISNVDYPEILSPRFNDMTRDAAGTLWIGSDAGLLRMDLAAGPDSLQRFDRSNSPLPGNQVRDVAVAPDGTIWLATSTVGGGAGGLAQFDPIGNTWNTWNFITDRVAVVPDPGGGPYTVWIDGFARIGTYIDGVFNWFDQPGTPPFTPYPVSLFSTDPVDESGNIWIALAGADGLGRLAPDGTWTVTGGPPVARGNVARVYAASGGRAVALTFNGDVFLWDGSWSSLGNWGNHNQTFAFAEDSAGDFWVGGLGGAAKYENGAWQRHRLTNTGMLGYFTKTIALAPNGDVAMNANAGPGVGGFDILHPDDTWSNANDFTYGLGLPWGIAADNCSAVAYRANGNLLFAPGFHGLYEYDGRNYTQIIPDFFDIEEVVEDGRGRIWDTRGSGLDMIDAAGVQTAFSPSNSPLVGGDTRSLRADPVNPGFVWFVTPFAAVHTDGVDWTLYDRALFGYTRPTDGNVLSSIAAASDGTVWFGVAGAGNGGLFHFDPADGSFTKFSPALGDPMPSDDVKVVDIAPDGSVWFNTFDVTFPHIGGVTHIDSGTWTTYSADTSPLPHNQVTQIRSRNIAGGYEVWIAEASEGIAVISVSTDTLGDLDGDGDVDLSDLSLMLAAFGSCEGDANYLAAADLDANGCVELVDLAELLGNFGT